MEIQEQGDRFLTTAWLVVFLVPIFSGCIDAEPSQQESDHVQAEVELPRGNETQEPQEDADSDSKNTASVQEPESDNATFDPGWPALEDAVIRPGVGIDSGTTLGLGVGEHATCTANFVFKSPENQTLYLGTAAHCVTKPSGPVTVEGQPPCPPMRALDPGTEVFIEGASQMGVLAYSSWHTMSQVQEDDGATCSGNDFALVEIAAEDRGLVHPALLHYGGPTRLANASHLLTNEKLYSYGRSIYHAEQENLKKREGYYRGPAYDGWTFDAAFVTPGIYGDSGSPVINSSGEAAGVLVTIHFLPTNLDTNGITSLDKALQYAKEHADIKVELATWPLLQEGMLPEWP